MVLIDTSAWIEHFRAPDPRVEELLEADQGILHPWVLLELALGSIPARARTLRDLGRLPTADVVRVPDVLSMIESRKLVSSGIGAIDAQLLAACLAQGFSLLTNDRLLLKQARALRVAFA